MEKSNIEKVKDVVLYAPVGALGFVKDNAPTFFSMFVSRGRREVTKTTIVAEEKLINTKHHGQMVAMGSDVAAHKAEKAVEVAKDRGEDIASAATEIALNALSFGNDLLNSVLSNFDSSDKDEESTEAVDINEEVKPAQSQQSVVEQDCNDTESAESSAYVPSDSELPSAIREAYEDLSAPEIIDLLDDLNTEQLHAIIKYELNYRNRQTIIHAVNHRLVG